MPESPGFKNIRDQQGSVVWLIGHFQQSSLTVDVKMEVAKLTRASLSLEEVPLIEPSTALSGPGKVIDRQKKLVDCQKPGPVIFVIWTIGTRSQRYSVGSRAL